MQNTPNDDIDTFYETSGSDMMPFKLSMNDISQLCNIVARQSVQF